jgi:hypothetical protein
MKQYLFPLGIPCYDGTPGLPGPKGLGKYSYDKNWSFSILQFFF